ncbi:hypothetical protein [Arthrobacter roseus]|uniref:hypothetical protein n=1 Tax=Arthrobacter roseus TaxID=136274 RepID=UPI0019643159|nr:hypothetical protein [Arthrobacter roseus]MBM7847425.1 hypothetical protein [Arthrobacter roseus]
MSETVELKQGSQLRAGNVLIGAIRVGEPGGVPTVRLALRDETTQVVDLQIGESAPLDGERSVTLVDVIRPDKLTGEGHGAAVLELDD